MCERRDSEASRAFYEQYHFPGSRPIDQDGLIFLRMFGSTMDRQRREDPARTIRVLDAGCGTGNTSIALAGHYPSVTFVGVDRSEASLRKARAGAENAGVPNLTFRRQDLLRMSGRGERFDVIVCLGVLHHTADMRKGLANLRSLLRNDGQLYLWIYGKHGRYLHAQTMRALSLLRSVADPRADPVELARDLLRHPGNGWILNDLRGRTDASAIEQRVLDDPVWIADQFLNPLEQLLDLKQVLRLVNGCGFAVQRIVGIDEAAAIRLLPPSLLVAYRRLSPYRQLLVLDLLMKPERYFLVLTRGSLSRKA